MTGHIGVDESGKGDYFGPLVIAACYVGPEHLAELEGVRDSKKLTDSVALNLSRRIRAVCPHAVVAIGPAKYNELYARIGNLNHLLAWGHAKAIENVLEIQPADLAISDQFADPRLILSRMQERGRGIRLESKVRAESDVAVAAASILARAEFLRRLQALSDEHGIPLPKGAGAGVPETAIRFAREKGFSRLSEVAKLHFKTTDKVRAAVGA